MSHRLLLDAGKKAVATIGRRAYTSGTLAGWGSGSGSRLGLERPVKLAVFDSMAHETPFLAAAEAEFDGLVSVTRFKTRLDAQTAGLAHGFDAASVFVNDEVNAAVVAGLRDCGVRHVAVRAAGFDHVDVAACTAGGLVATRVPRYSPYAVAEFAMCLLLAANRRVVPAVARVRQGNFGLAGLVGFDLRGKTVGVVGTGNIGRAFVGIAQGFGCRVLCADPHPDAALAAAGAEYVALDRLFREAHAVSLHCPLTPASVHLVNADSLASMRDGVVIVNTSRGALIDTTALIDAIKCRKVGAAGIDVYEYEAGMFFRDLSANEFIADNEFSRLLSFNNVIVTGHQGFLTTEALTKITNTMLLNVYAFRDIPIPSQADKDLLAELAENKIC
ncbi:hypothetical protein HK100_004767 [Physocladia obscura]|uniref:D-lactate dehydrogenase n=1 Tax=Physocladia obscura TaxID=109957 RepID=A0AAD5SUQ1_9FUNG|nr:hypothetical protein HK100_004767 [Physocladia obscura]